MEITIPVGGKDEVINVPEKNIQKIIMPVNKPELPNVEEKIREAILNPIGTKSLSQIVREQFGKPGKRGGPYHNVAIGVDSWNRPTKHYLLFPPVLEELEKAGIKDEDIVIIEGCGVHRSGRPEEWEKKWGKDLIGRFKDQMYSHTAPPPEYKKFQPPVKLVGFTNHNCPVRVNKYAVESDVLILLGAISMNVNFGYGGGSKMIIPGMASHEGIVLSHSLAPPHKREGGRWQDNEARLDMHEMADVMGVDFIVNVAHNIQGEIVAVAAGHHIQAWTTLIPVCREMYVNTGIEPADIFICSASPRHTLSGAFATDHMWAINGGTRATKPGGTMIIAHRAVWRQHPIAHLGCPYFKVCEDMVHAIKPRPIDELIELAYYRTRWESRHIYTGGVVMNEKEVVVSGEGYRYEDFEGSGFKYIPDLNEAIDYALQKHGKDATVNISPYGGRFTCISGDGEDG